MDLVHHDNTGRRYLMGSIWAGSVTRADWALFFMATVVYFFAADIFHLRTLENLYALWRPGSPVPLLHRFYRFGSMNMLISLGTSIAYFASIAVLAVNATQPSASEGTSSYFDSVVFLTMFLLIGRFLEAKSKAKAGDAVASLGALRPSEAILLHSSFASLQDEDGEPSEHTDAVQERISVDLLEVGDLVRVPHGSSPPYDGVVQHGETRFDESSLTGEARLVSKAVGDSVFSGTTNNGNSISVRLSTVSGTSLLDQIIKVVREGQARRAPVERVADIITSHFVPFVVLVGISTWLIWLALGVSGALPREWLDTSTGGWVFWSLQFSIAVFVIACPCGIGLAAPTALFVGGGLAARNGILVKGGGEAFQEASTLDCVVFDKTGTLTEGGDPSVTQYQDYDCMKTNTALALAKALEEHSSHPLARAIVKYCSSQDQQICIEDVEELPGKGVAAMCQFESTAHNVIIGNEALMADYGVNVSQATIQNWKQQGLSIALLATKSTTEASPEGTDYRLAAAFGISDRIRPEAPAVIQALQSRGVAVWMLSGDNQTTANAVGRSLGIHAENIIAGVLPSEKAEKIKYLQRSLSARKGVMSWLSSRSRATVAMVGDGINDAPALATADVGIAIGSGSDVALSSAHFVLLSSHLDTLLTLIDLSRLVFRRVWFNFGWALVYNLIALPVAAGVLYPIKSNGSHVRLDPAWASLAMALSSVSVVTSSLLLRTSIPGVGFRLESSGSAR
ncbi:hypothetical protein H2203_007790 [Taxawa tesnikishii (nom. ined.)]|nr:hypothetical protein H2203_007790 [Dothideales sp. JES 119]